MKEVPQASGTGFLSILIHLKCCLVWDMMLNKGRAFLVAFSSISSASLPSCPLVIDLCDLAMGESLCFQACNVGIPMSSGNCPVSTLQGFSACAYLTSQSIDTVCSMCPSVALGWALIGFASVDSGA